MLIFSYATDALMERIGLDADSRGQSGNSLFTPEAHINYLHEVKLGTEVWVQTQIIGFDRKRLHVYHSLHRAGFDEALAASEQMLLHVDWRDRSRRRSVSRVSGCCKAWWSNNRICRRPSSWAG